MADKKEQLKELLRLHYGFKDFWQGQERAIDNILQGRNVLVIMPTGGGKSLIYQLPGLVMEGATIVVSPLIALMKDQVDSLTSVGIPATFVNSTITLNEAKERLQGVAASHYKLLFIAPERFNSPIFLQELKNIKVSLFAIDEAHCISQWGHDFRPSYLRLKRAIEFTGNPVVAALTATATPEVRKDIIRQLHLQDPKTVVTGFARPNLQFGVIHASEGQKKDYITEAVRKANGGPGIVYAGTRSKADEIAQELLNEGVEAVSYHAGMDPGDRHWVQEGFMQGKVEVVVATNAFGLGIDKKNIRFVIHHNLPGTIEAYYQEAGRAGRDREQSFCLLLYSPKDRNLQEFFIKGDNPDPNIILEIYDTLLEMGGDRVLFTYAELSQMLSERVPEMAIGTALKILEKEGYISKTNEKSANAYIRFLTDKEDVYKGLSARAKKQNQALERLYDKYKEEDLRAGMDFSIEEWTEVLGVKRDLLKRMLNKLSQEAKAEFNPPFRGTEVRIIKRVSPGEVKIDFDGLKRKADNAYKKLDIIEDYVYHSGCRQKFILDYFEDSNAKECGVCDNCMSKQRPVSPLSRNKPRDIGKKRSTLNTKLTQLETLELYQKGYTAEEIAQYRELSLGTIADHICFLLKKKLIKDIGNLVSQDKQKKIKKAIKKTGAEKIKPLKEEVGTEISYEEIKMVIAKLEAGD
jgi:ATP-dependent DNA helicase RecQ